MDTVLRFLRPSAVPTGPRRPTPKEPRVTPIESPRADPEVDAAVRRLERVEERARMYERELIMQQRAMDHA